MSAITNKQDVKTQITEKQDKIAKNKTIRITFEF